MRATNDLLPHRRHLALRARQLSHLIQGISAAVLLLPAVASAQSAKSDEVTFHRDIEPILQRSCQNCHHAGGVAPMSLVTYEEAAPYAGLMEYKTGLRDRAGAMPPYYLEK